MMPSYLAFLIPFLYIYVYVFPFLLSSNLLGFFMRLDKYILLLCPPGLLNSFAPLVVHVFGLRVPCPHKHHYIETGCFRSVDDPSAPL
jgi:hypothetical protein